MKTMTCKQLGGACDEEFHGETFEEIAEQSRQHGNEMYKKGDVAHLEAMQEMSEMMNDPEAMQQWMEKKRQQFKALPDSE
jgi:polyhydroxyalkanoate synthesis regulator phasin